MDAIDASAHLNPSSDYNSPNLMENTQMTERNPILITGAGGQVGGVSRLMVDMLLEQGHPVRAFVRRDDQRAQSLREAGADVFVGDLLKPRTWPQR